VGNNQKCCKVTKVWLHSRVNFCFLITVLLFFSASCKPERNIDRAFYFWKNKFSLSAAESGVLEQLKINKLYVKLFDVAVDEERREPVPVARVLVDTAALQVLNRLGIEMIPVVFITNESLQLSDSAAVITLAGKIVNLVSLIQQKEKLGAFHELQIDCDWAGSTKEKYFSLLKRVHELMKDSNSVFTADGKLSATIRLHQVKYKNKTGIPPVDKGLLMCYNMGNLKNPAVKNSIFDTDEMKKYLAGLQNYPLPLDAALPLFEWAVYFSKDVYKGIVSNISHEQLQYTGNFSNNEFIFYQDTVLQNIAFSKGDKLRFEAPAAQEINRAIAYLKNTLPSEPQHFTVSFYHLDELILNKHPQHEIESFYNSFR
jgi:hypothetical protein